MAKADHRQELGRRLQEEMARKGLSETAVADEARVSEPIVKDYLAGKRNISFSELVPICDALGADAMQLLAPKFQKTNLNYRNTSSAARQFASRVENAFLLVRDWLPVPRRPSCHAPGLDEGYSAMLLTEVRRAVMPLREKYQSVEALYEAHDLPVLPLDGGDEGFDAFFLHQGKHCLVCVNLDKPNARIEFSLLHEFAHFVFDAERPVPLDEDLIVGSDYYRNSVPVHARQEYIANKFAQLWLVPFDEAERLSRSDADAVQYILDHRVSPDVVANAIRDVRAQRPGQVSYVDIRKRLVDELAARGVQWGGRAELREWLQGQWRKIRELLAAPLEEDFGDSRREQVLQAMGMIDGD